MFHKYLFHLKCLMYTMYSVCRIISNGYSKIPEGSKIFSISHGRAKASRPCHVDIFPDRFFGPTVFWGAGAGEKVSSIMAMY